MLSFLRIRDLAILDDVFLEFGPGLNVLTGETGAGKSIIVDAIGLILGARGAADLVREGKERLLVEAQFDLGSRPDAQAVKCAGPGFHEDGDEIIIRRELTAQGRGRALVNGHLVTAGALRTLGEALADMHGQHQHQSLLRSDAQREALDRFSAATEIREQVSRLHETRRALEQEREALSQDERGRARHEESLRREIEEIEAAGVRPGEDGELVREEAILRHAGEVARLAGESFALLSDDDASAVARLAGAQDRLERLAAIDPQAARAASLAAEARVAAAEAASGLSSYLDAEAFDPGRLDVVAGRLAALERLKRRFGPSLDDVLAHLDRAHEEVLALRDAPERLARLEEEIATLRQSYAKAAAGLSGLRRAGAKRLARAVAGELEAMAMEGTKVTIAVDTLPEVSWSALGADAVEFLIEPNAGEGLRPLARIASGGELSRLMLALRNAAAGSGDARTLVFDEVDSGVGGRVAERVGERLASLSRGQQILCVTHLPQIAAFADRHFQVTKKTAGGRTSAGVAHLDAEGRVEELARMLGGSPAETARRHAAALVTRRQRSSPP